MADNNGHGDPTELEQTADLADELIESALGQSLQLGNLRRPDGVITRNMNNVQMGVLKSVMTAVEDDNKYRQELKTAFFLSTQEADDWLAAFHEAKRYGCDVTFNIDWLIARSAGIQGARVKAVLDTMSKQETTINSRGLDYKKKWWQRGQNNNNQSSPIS